VGSCSLHSCDWTGGLPAEEAEAEKDLCELGEDAAARCAPAVAALLPAAPANPLTTDGASTRAAAAAACSSVCGNGPGEDEAAYPPGAPFDPLACAACLELERKALDLALQAARTLLTQQPPLRDRGAAAEGAELLGEAQRFALRVCELGRFTARGTVLGCEQIEEAASRFPGDAAAACSSLGLCDDGSSPPTSPSSCSNVSGNPCVSLVSAHTQAAGIGSSASGDLKELCVAASLAADVGGGSEGDDAQSVFSRGRPAEILGACSPSSSSPSPPSSPPISALFPALEPPPSCCLPVEEGSPLALLGVEGVRPLGQACGGGGGSGGSGSGTSSSSSLAGCAPRRACVPAPPLVATSAPWAASAAVLSAGLPQSLCADANLLEEALGQGYGSRKEACLSAGGGGSGSGSGSGGGGACVWQKGRGSLGAPFWPRVLNNDFEGNDRGYGGGYGGYGGYGGLMIDRGGEEQQKSVELGDFDDGYCVDAATAALCSLAGVDGCGGPRSPGQESRPACAVVETCSSDFSGGSSSSCGSCSSCAAALAEVSSAPVAALGTNFSTAAEVALVASSGSLGPWTPGTTPPSTPPQQPQWLFNQVFGDKSLDALEESARELCLRSWGAATGIVYPALPPPSTPSSSPSSSFLFPSAAALEACSSFVAELRADPVVATRPAAVCSRLPLPEEVAGEGSRVCSAGCAASGLGLDLCSTPKLPSPVLPQQTPTPTPTLPASSSSSKPLCLSDVDCPPSSDPTASTCDASGLDASLLGSFLLSPPQTLPSTLCSPLATCDADSGSTVVRCAGECADFCETEATKELTSKTNEGICSGVGDPVCGPQGVCVPLPPGGCRNATGGCDSLSKKVTFTPCFGKCSPAGAPQILKVTLSPDYSTLVLELDRAAQLTSTATVSALFGSLEAAVAAGVVAGGEASASASASAVLSLADDVDFSQNPPFVTHTLRLSLLATSTVKHGDSIVVGPQAASGPAVVDALTGLAFVAAPSSSAFVVEGQPGPPSAAVSGPSSLGSGCPASSSSSSSSSSTTQGGGASWSALPSRTGIRLPPSVEWRATGATPTDPAPPELAAAVAAANAAGPTFEAEAALSLSPAAASSLPAGKHTLVLKVAGPGGEEEETVFVFSKASVPLPQLLLPGAEISSTSSSVSLVRFVASKGPLRLRPQLETNCPGSAVVFSWGYRTGGSGASPSRLAANLIETSPGGGTTRELTLGTLSSATGSGTVTSGPVPGALPGSNYSLRLLARFEGVALSGNVNPVTGEDASWAVLDVDAIATAAQLSAALAGPSGDAPVVPLYQPVPLTPAEVAAVVSANKIPSLAFSARALDPDDAIVPAAQRLPLVFDWSCSVLAPSLASSSSSSSSSATPTPTPTQTTPPPVRRLRSRSLLAVSSNSSSSESSSSRALVPLALSVSPSFSSSSYVRFPCDLDPTGVLDDGAGKLVLSPWALRMPRSSVEPQSEPPLLVEVGVSVRRGSRTATASPSLTLVPYDASGSSASSIRPLGTVRRWCSTSGGGCLGAESPPTEPLKLSYEPSDAATLADNQARRLSYLWSCSGDGCPAALSSSTPTTTTTTTKSSDSSNKTSSAVSVAALASSSSASSAVSGMNGRVLVVYPYDSQGNPSFKDGSVLTFSVKVTRTSDSGLSSQTSSTSSSSSSTAVTVVRIARRPTCAASDPASCLVVTPASGTALITNFTLSTGPWIATASANSESSSNSQPPLSFEFGVVRASDGARQPRARGWPSATFDLGTLVPTFWNTGNVGDGFTSVYACAVDPSSGAEACSTKQVAVAAVPASHVVDSAALSSGLSAAAEARDPTALVAAARAIVVASPFIGGNGGSSGGGAALVAAKQEAISSLARALLGSGSGSGGGGGGSGGGGGGSSPASQQPLSLSPGDALAMVSLLKELTSPVGDGGGTVRGSEEGEKEI